MKKLLSIALALALILSISVSSFAEVYIDGEKQTPDESGVVYVFTEEAHSVTLNDESDKLILNTLDGVNGEGEISAVNASEGIAVISLSVSQSGSADAIVAKDGADVAVRFFDVKETGTGSAINASGSGTKVAIDGSLGSVDESGNGNAINASDGANVNITLDVTENDVGNAVDANGAGTKVKIGQNVTEKGAGWAIAAGEGAKVEVEGKVTAEDYEVTDGRAISAFSESTVSVGGDVEQTYGKYAIFAEGADVTVGGNVTQTSGTNAVKATNGATVTVVGAVTGDGTTGSAILADGALVIVGGDVERKNSTGNTLKATGGASILVEGIVTGSIVNKDGTEGTIYLAQLDGEIEEPGLDSNLDLIHYLIGFSDDSLLSEIGFVDESGIIEHDLVAGVEKTYKYFTSTADASVLSGKKVILKPNSSNKVLTVSGFDDANVQYLANKDGTVTFTIGDAFKGGMQNLVLVLADKPQPTPDPKSDSSPNYAPVYYVVPARSVTVVEFTVPEGVEEGLITNLDSADHAGLTVDSSLVDDAPVKVLKDGKELNAKDFSVYTHSDGSIDVILSSTYLFSLGSGSYDFTAIVGGLKIPFTAVVAK